MTSSAAPTATPRRRTVWWLATASIVVFIALAATGSAAYFAYRVAGVDLPPEAPELEEVALERSPPSSPNAALTEAAQGGSRLDPDVMSDAMFELETGSWLADPTIVRGASDAGRELAAAMAQPGCLEPDAGIAVVSRAREYLASIVARLQLGDTEPAARDLTQLLGELVAIRTRCAHSLVSGLVLAMLTDEAHRTVGYALAVTDLDAATLDALARAAVAVEAVPSELPDMMALEWTSLAEQGLPIPSPVRRAYARLAWLAALPPGTDALHEPTSEERWWADATESHPQVIATRIGADEARAWMIAEGILSATRPRIPAYHQLRCRAPHRRARWLRGLAARGREVPALAEPPPRDVRGEAPDLDLDEDAACAPPSRRPAADRDPPPDLPPSPP